MDHLPEWESWPMVFCNNRWHAIGRKGCSRTDPAVKVYGGNQKEDAAFIVAALNERDKEKGKQPCE